MMPKLIPCPNCGGKAKMRRGLPNMGNSKYMWARGECLECGFTTKMFVQQKYQTFKYVTELAADAWNNGVVR